MLPKSRVIRCFGIFALAFGLRQAADFFFFSTTPYGSGVGSLASFGIALIAVLLIRSEGSGLRKHGFLLPKRASRLLTISLFLAVVYIVIVLFVPGGMSGFEAIPGASISWGLLLAVGSVLLAVVAAETVFRGYIQTNLESAYGFSRALIVVSVMFILYMLPIASYFTADLGKLLNLALPLLGESVFLCFFFRETRTLLCPIAFATTVTLLETFTPLVPTTIEYTTSVSLICFVFLVPIMQGLMDEVKKQNEKLESIPETESEQPEERM